MSAQFLTIRLTEAEARLVERLNQQTGLTKSQLVKKALKRLSLEPDGARSGGLFELGANRFGRYGNKDRQSSDIKKIVRARIDAKRSRR